MPELPSHLRRPLGVQLIALRGRVMLRAATLCLTLVSSSVLVSVLLLELLPRYVLGWSVGLAATLAVGLAVGALLAAQALRNETWPGMHEAALWLESAGRGNGALATAVSAGQGPFMPHVAREAQRFLAGGSRENARPLLPLPLLVGAPVATMAALLLTLAALSAPEQHTSEIPGTQPATSKAYSAVDVGATRDASDAEARDAAMRLQKAATALRDQAANMRDAGNERDAERALAQAREALKAATGDNPKAVAAALAMLPQRAGETEPERKAAAASLESAAAKLESQAGGTRPGERDSGGTGTFDAGAAELKFAPLPPLQSSGSVQAAELATQSGARRAMVARAREALK